MHPADHLQSVAKATGSCACVGLDPRPALLPDTLRRSVLARMADGPEAVAAAFVSFNDAILEAIAGHCAAVKPQVACYEAYGSAGIQALEHSIARARRLGIPVIVDGKRNDIGSTATHYRQAWLRAGDEARPPGLAAPLAAATGQGDWLTVNGYLGIDGIRPFLADPGQGGGIFVLVKTSNPSSGDLQGQPCGPDTVMEAMARLVARWGSGREGACGLSDVGAVVGATWPEEARRLRALMPSTLFLVPGYGAQGGSAADALAGQRDDGSGIIVNSSRGIIAAWQEADTDDWAAAARSALDRMNADLAR